MKIGLVIVSGTALFATLIVIICTLDKVTRFNKKIKKRGK